MASTGSHQSDRRPGGAPRPSAAVYRRRRLLVLVLVLLLVAALAVGAAFLTEILGGEREAEGADQIRTSAPASPTEALNPPPEPTTAATATAALTATADPTATAEPSASTAAPTPAATGCADTVVVVAETDESSYAEGEDPVLSLVIRNEGDEPCDVNVGTSQMEFVLTNDDERIFSSVDCQTDSRDLQRILEPGAEERATFDWSRNRTVPECTVVEEEPAPGEYTLVTRLGARSSTPVEFTLE